MHNFYLNISTGFLCHFQQDLESYFKIGLYFNFVHRKMEHWRWTLHSAIFQILWPYKLLMNCQIDLKASAHSFKQFTSRLLKSTFSLSMHIYNSDGCHAWFHLHGASRPARSASEATKYKMKNLLKAGLGECSPFKWPYYIHVLPILM